MQKLSDRFKSLNLAPYTWGIDSEQTLCREMMRFGQHPEARAVPQFLALKEVGWGTLKNWVDTSDKMKNAYQTMIALLWCKWFEFAMDSKKLPPHQARIVEKFINVYDEQMFDAINAKAKEIAIAQASAPKHYVAENYQTEELSGPYKEIYDENESKRISAYGRPDESGCSSSPKPVQAEGISEANLEGSGRRVQESAGDSTSPSGEGHHSS